MNPSAKGWIKKHVPGFITSKLVHDFNEADIYKSFRSLGFIYGTSIGILNAKEDNPIEFTEEERTKVNLLDALIYTYYDTIENATQEACLNDIIEFYRVLNAPKTSLFKIPSIGRSSIYSILENILDQRVQTNESFVRKNFSHLITNALLYIDVLSFEYFLIHEVSPLPYAERLETTLINAVCLTLDQKEDKQDYDKLLLRLFRRSVRYNDLIDDSAITLEDLHLEQFQDTIERFYILDLACLAIWDDNEADETEYAFVKALGKTLKLSNSEINEAFNTVHHFIEAYKSKIALFQYSNPVKHFYKQTNRTVKLLIIRNKKRLLKELSESKELVILLGQSTLRDLSNEEKKKVKSQLLDICKTVPSLAIFILPGGTLLLPLLIKMIPRLLPSAFNENLD